MSISSAIGQGRKARVSGYKIHKGFFNNETPNLPQVIAIFGEANTANQSNLSTDKKEITSAQEAGEEYGFGSPIHQMMRILRPVSGEGVGGVPTIVFPQETDAAATATEIVLTITGNANKNTTHSLVVNGRSSVDFQPYNYSVVKGDTPTITANKIVDAVNNVLGSPLIASSNAGVVTFVTKWKGLTSSEISVDIDTGKEVAGVTYAETSNTSGSGGVDLSNALSQFDNEWVTIVINSYGTETLDILEQFNGKPDSDNPTGRFQGDIFKPFVSFFGSVLDDKDDLVTITHDVARQEEQTNVLCPAPKSKGMTFEAAANMAVLYAVISNNTPHLDVNNKSYPDMPVPSSIGDMSEYNNRDFLVKKGCSTVLLDKGSYKVQDLVTTYHPAGETPLQYAYVRNLNIDWNVAFGYKILEEVNVKDHVIVDDLQVTDVVKSIKSKEWKAILFEYFDNLGERALLNSPKFSKNSLKVERSTINPDRFETFFEYKRTGMARIESTDVKAGF